MKRIFLVEDDELYGKVLKKKLEAFYEVQYFNNPDDCLIALIDTTPDVLVSDYYMPEMKGIDLFEQVKDKLKDMQFIILSSNEESEVVFDSVKRGLRNYVMKDDKAVEALRSLIENDADLLDD